MKSCLKYSVSAIFLACISAFCAGPAVQKKPVLDLPLNEGRGSAVIDVAAKNKIEVVNPQFAKWGEGTRGPVVEFCNKHQAMERACVKLPWPELDLSKPFTIMMEIRTAPDLMRKRSYQLAVIGGHDEGCFALELAWDMFYVAFSNKGERASIVTKPTELKISANTWYKLVWVYDGKVVRTYVDGMERAYGEAEFKSPAAPYILLGASAISGAGYGFEGLMADFRVYDYAFTSDEVAATALDE